MARCLANYSMALPLLDNQCNESIMGQLELHACVKINKVKSTQDIVGPKKLEMSENVERAVGELQFLICI